MWVIIAPKLLVIPAGTHLIHLRVELRVKGLLWHIAQSGHWDDVLVGHILPILRIVVLVPIIELTLRKIRIPLLESRVIRLKWLVWLISLESELIWLESLKMKFLKYRLLGVVPWLSLGVKVRLIWRIKGWLLVKKASRLIRIIILSRLVCDIVLRKLLINLLMNKALHYLIGVWIFGALTFVQHLLIQIK